MRVSRFGFGCARIGGIFQNDPRTFLAMLAIARDAGINFFDTADIYSQGESESLLGKAFRHGRDRVLIASKGGYCLPARRKLIARIKPLVRPAIRLLKLKRERVSSGVRGAPTQDFSPAHLQSAVEHSLRRLRTDYIDLYQLHSPSLEAVQAGEWHDALETLKRAGKIRHYGVSCDTAEVGLAALQQQGVCSLQLAVSALEHTIADRVLPELASRELGGIARECLANGLLVKPADQIQLDQFFPAAETARRSEELAELRRRAEAEGSSLASFAMRYASSLPGVSVTLLGARSVAQLRDLLRQLPS